MLPLNDDTWAISALVTMFIDCKSALPTQQAKITHCSWQCRGRIELLGCLLWTDYCSILWSGLISPMVLCEVDTSFHRSRPSPLACRQVYCWQGSARVQDTCINMSDIFSYAQSNSHSHGLHTNFHSLLCRWRPNCEPFLMSVFFRH
jgi:hypothetical protein